MTPGFLHRGELLLIPLPERNGATNISLATGSGVSKSLPVARLCSVGVMLIESTETDDNAVVLMAHGHQFCFAGMIY